MNNSNIALTAQNKRYGNRKFKALFTGPYFKPKSDIISYKLLPYQKGKPNMVLTVDAENYWFLAKLSKNSFSTSTTLRSQKTKDAYIKAYFLFELLVQDIGFTDCMRNEDIRLSIGSNETGISSETMISIRDKLVEDGFIWVDSTEYIKSVKVFVQKKRQGSGPMSKIHNYSYAEDLFLNSSVFFIENPKAKDKSYKIQFFLSETIYKLVVMYNQIRHTKTQDSLLSILLRFFRGNSLVINTLDSETIENEVNDDPNRYVGPYEKLEFKGLTSRDVLRIQKWETLFTWVVHHKQKAKVTANSRLWHPFHSLAREYRHFAAYNGSPLIEAMDVHNCFYVLMLKGLELSDGINKEELKRYRELVKSGKFYEMFIPYVSIHPDEIKKGMSVRDVVKEKLQSYRNIFAENKLIFAHGEIDFAFKTNFPTIRDYLLNYPTTTNAEGKKVKRLQSDMCKVETYLISQVCFKLVRDGLTPFSLHDGIYVSEDDLECYRVKYGLDSTTDAQSHIEQYFWHCFDELIPDKVREIIRGELD